VTQPPLLLTAQQVADFLATNPTMDDRWAAEDRLVMERGNRAYVIWRAGRALAGHTLGDDTGGTT